MYIVYHIESTQSFKTFSTESAAKRSVTCANRNAGGVKYAYADLETYQNTIVYTKQVRNIMSGKMVEIPSNTPHCCDPSTETFWSM